MTVRIEKTGHVWTIIHSRPKARNAVTPESAAALAAAFAEFEAGDARVGVFYGEGGAFCAGWDLKYVSRMTDAEFQTEIVDRMAFPLGANTPPRAPMGPSRMEFTKPVIGAIEGPAVAGGMELALLCDMRVMGENAYMGVYCRRWGVPLIDGGTVRLPRLVGQGKALDLILTGRKVDAQECHRIGLCEYVVADGETRTKAEALAHEIAKFPQSTMLADRRSAIEGCGMSVRNALRLEWANAVDTLRRDGIRGAGRFAGGAGRHGDFEDI
ncbi:crotonase/enoyl-CoA hydratase family protein [Roseovarius sp. CAU 1744]|uniref:crotonase/enoyl-CoA hydratase family protein n=1 Tax=Roseovarius sp. CAU 1744 TaxID=3140368 RepID=UPI00325A812E